MPRRTPVVTLYDDLPSRPKISDNRSMTEPETEAETLDRLEAALARIAMHAVPAASQRETPRPPPDPNVIEALDTMIAHLRAVVQPPRQEG
jgi:hypothetical protein